MRFLSNIYNPNLSDAKAKIGRRTHETIEEAWANHKKRLEGKVIGQPKATKAYSVYELKQAGMVGVYATD